MPVEGEVRPRDPLSEAMPAAETGSLGTVPFCTVWGVPPSLCRMGWLGTGTFCTILAWPQRLGEKDLALRAQPPVLFAQPRAAAPRCRPFCAFSGGSALVSAAGKAVR